MQIDLFPSDWHLPHTPTHLISPHNRTKDPTDEEDSLNFAGESPKSVPEIRIKCLGSFRAAKKEKETATTGLLHSTDTCLDLITRNALNRNRSFIEHIQEIPGIEQSSGSYATVPKKNSPKRRSNRRRRRRPKYVIGQSSDDDDEEVAKIEAETGGGGKSATFDQFLTVGMKRKEL